MTHHHVYEVKHSVPQYHPPHFKCSVASSGQVPWCWTEQMLKSPVITENSTGHFTPDHWRAAEGTLAPGRLCMCCVNPSTIEHFVFFASFHQSKGFENLMPFKLSNGGIMWLGTTKRRAQEHNTMRTPVWTELANGVKVKLYGALAAHWALCVCVRSPALGLNRPRTVLVREISGSLEMKTCYIFNSCCYCEWAYTTLLCEISARAIIP